MNAPQQGFAKGFRGEEDETIKGQEMPMGEAAPMDTPMEGEAAGGEATPAVVVAIGAPDAKSDAGEAGDASAAAAAEEGAAVEAPAAEAGDLEMNQSEKSWNGRLTAREKELKARADELDARAAEIESQKLPTYDEAVSTLTADFGEDFVKLIQVVASGATQGEVAKSTAEIREQVDGVIEGVRGAFGQVHKEMISSVHEDFEEIAESEEFRAFIEGMDEEAKAAAMQIIESGTARQIVKLLNEFKKTLSTEGNDNSRYDADALDAAAGVRSAGGRAPSLGGDAIAAGNEVDRFRAGFNA